MARWVWPALAACAACAAWSACAQVAGLDGLDFQAGTASEGGSPSAGGGSGAYVPIGGAPACGDNHEPTGDGCPDACSNCIAGQCQIDCDATDCPSNIICPGGFECIIQCGGDTKCEAVQIACPPDTDCRLECHGYQACRDATLFCDGGTCAVECTGEESCEGTVVECGDNTCAMTCDGGFFPDVECGDACECSPCMITGG